MEPDRFDLPARLVELLRAWAAMTRDARSDAEGQALKAEVRGIGEAAAHFGGWDAMQKLDTAVGKAGGPNQHLNELWDGIGAWCA